MTTTATTNQNEDEQLNPKVVSDHEEVVLDDDDDHRLLPDKQQQQQQQQSLVWKSKKSILTNAVLVSFFMSCGILFCYSISADWNWITYPLYFTSSRNSSSPTSLHSLPSKRTVKEYPLICNNTNNPNQTHTCPRNNYPRTHNPTNPNPQATCPDYFHWIYEDLKPWKESGITREMVEKGRRTAHFRVVILDGRIYVEKFKKSIQTRDLFTQWGIVQLLRWYPGRLPNLEIMFDCNDRPVISSTRINSRPPPLFKYCSDPWSLDIVFPDWSFWGWPETNIKPWRIASKAIEEGSKRIKWEDREPYAYWKGNPGVAPKRREFMKCNVSTQNDWNVRLYPQDWGNQAKLGFNESKLEDQCTYRYKIYIEGWAWSVSEKYILACDSMTLLVKPRYHDFINRGMLPLKHYWPIRDNDKCKSLKFAVEWGNNHTTKAQEIGKAGSEYIHKDMKMELVYDYMFHMLNEYAKLQNFTPAIPPNAIELCPETMACQAEGIWRKSMEDSLEKSPSEGVPCAMPPPYDPLGLKNFFDEKSNLTRQVEMWEDEYWGKMNPKAN